MVPNLARRPPMGGGDRACGAIEQLGIAEFSGLDQEGEEFMMLKYARPSGYCAQTLLHFSSFAVVSILDYGAMCSGMPEEAALTIISHALQSVQ